MLLRPRSPANGSCPCRAWCCGRCPHLVDRSILKAALATIHTNPDTTWHKRHAKAFTDCSMKGIAIFYGNISTVCSNETSATMLRGLIWPTTDDDKAGAWRLCRVVLILVSFEVLSAE